MDDREQPLGDLELIAALRLNAGNPPMTVGEWLMSHAADRLSEREGWVSGVKGIVAYDLDDHTVTLVMDGEGAVWPVIQQLPPANRAVHPDALPSPPGKLGR